MDLNALKISDKKKAILHWMNIHTPMDLLTYYPFRYERIEEKPFLAWNKNDKVALEAKIVSRAHVIRFNGKQSVTKFKVVYEAEEIEISLFNRPWVTNFKMGKSITLFGKYDGQHRVVVQQYNFQPLQLQIGLSPIYNVREGITQKELQKNIEKAFTICKDQITDFVPKAYQQKYQLMPREKALYYIHHPSDENALKQSLRHLKYEEFLKFQLAMQTLKEIEKSTVHGVIKHFDIDDVYQLENSFAFQITNDQKTAIDDILYDLKSEHIMYRMLQGDVGCGKTLVAAFGLYACVLSHKQAAFLAPTEILAKQHLTNLNQMFKDADIQIAVLYSSMKATEKKLILKQLEANEIDILIGTHALFQQDVTFHDLGMVVADEQHRFGVTQRKKMLEKGEKVDFLLMSATPIPRTLAISLYGDMDVSTIQELPKGRQQIETKLIASKSMAAILEDILAKVDEGNQCYVVCPAIEKNDEYEMRNVEEIFAGMQASLGKKYRIALLHGRMNTQQKDTVMQDFVNGKIHILVSTTVIEVGVDVANANVMVIYDAHRFGLSQIHQLRGRIGRGTKKGYCYLLSDTQEEDTLKRLSLCASLQDGFAIAKADLALRGPGDLLGTRQSGIPGFVLGDIIQDTTILEVARNDATEIIKEVAQGKHEQIQVYIQQAIQQGTYVD